jgi:hypothetical protein
MSVLGGIGCGLVNGITGMIPGLIQGTMGGLLGLGVLGLVIALLLLYEFKKHALFFIALIGLIGYLKFFACA